MRNIQMTIKRLVAIEESGSSLSASPLCGALPEGRHHDAACDGNVAAVTRDADQHILPLFTGSYGPSRWFTRTARGSENVAAVLASGTLAVHSRPCAIVCLERALESKMDSMNGQHGKQASWAARQNSQAGMLSVLLSILASKRVVLDRQHGRNRLDVGLGSLTDSAK